MKIIAASLVATLALAAAFTATAQPARSGAGTDVAAKAPGLTQQCFAMRDVRNHTIGADNELYLDVFGRGVYRVTMSNRCLSAAMSSDPLIVRSQASQTICKPTDMDIAIASPVGGIPKACIVSSIALLAPAEVAALPKGLRP